MAQVLAEIAKSPLVVALLMSSVDVPVFFSVTVLAVVVLPTVMLPKLSEVGESVTDDAGLTVWLSVPVLPLWLASPE
jgi:hypothetical protein